MTQARGGEGGGTRPSPLSLWLPTGRVACSLVPAGLACGRREGAPWAHPPPLPVPQLLPLHSLLPPPPPPTSDPWASASSRLPSVWPRCPPILPPCFSSCGPSDDGREDYVTVERTP